MSIGPHTPKHAKMYFNDTQPLAQTYSYFEGGRRQVAHAVPAAVFRGREIVAKDRKVKLLHIHIKRF